MGGVSCSNGQLCKGSLPEVKGGEGQAAGQDWVDEVVQDKPANDSFAPAPGPAIGPEAFVPTGAAPEATAPENGGVTPCPAAASLPAALALAATDMGKGAPSEDILAMTSIICEEEHAKSTDVVGRRRRCCTPEMKTLGLATMLFTTITIAQFFGAMAANSQVLMMDCISMGVDAGTMFLNMIVETRKGKSCHRSSELVVGVVSLVALIYFTLSEMVESIIIIEARSVGEDDESVDAYIVMGFAIVGLIFDITSMMAFFINNRRNKSGREMNMWTATLHVGADSLRSTATLVLSIVILHADIDSVSLDAWASIVVAATILAGAAVGVVGWCRSFFFAMKGY